MKYSISLVVCSQGFSSSCVLAMRGRDFERDGSEVKNQIKRQFRRSKHVMREKKNSVVAGPLGTFVMHRSCLLSSVDMTDKLFER